MGCQTALEASRCRNSSLRGVQHGAEDSIVNNDRLDPGVEFPSKPCDRERLAMTVRRVLDGPAKNSEDPNEPELETRPLRTLPPRQINKAGQPAKNINPR